MVYTFTSPADRKTSAGHFVAGQAAVLVATLAALLVMPGTQAWGQRSPVHYFNRGGLPPGAIGSQQLLRGGPLPGYFQPVEIEAPPGASISLAVQGQFSQSHAGPIKAGLLIGQVYFFRVTGIRHNEGLEVYPTVEVINRLYPPPGQEARFPIPIQVTQEELELALSGRYVTRVIYLENPNTALPVRQDRRLQPYFEVHPNDDPLEVADRLGRPMAIVRMGSRVPDSSDSSYSLGDRGAPLLLFPPAERPAEPIGPAEPPAMPGDESIVPPVAPPAPVLPAPEGAAALRETSAPPATVPSASRLANRLFKLPGNEPEKIRGNR